MEREPSSRRRLLVLGSITLAAGCLGLQLWRYPLDDSAPFGGDSWEYQSLGVNLAKGLGYRFGGLAPLADYRFKPDGHAPGSPQVFAEPDRFQVSHFYRTPGYPLFLALVYSVAGVHPLVVKLLQALMSALACAALPWISSGYWGRRGLLSGAAAALVFAATLCPDPTQIMAESLLLFSLLAWSICFAAWERRGGGRLLVGLGALTGWALLVKGWLVFLPPLVVVAIALHRGTPGRARVLGAALFLGALVASVLPWSLYASSRAGQVVVLSTQGEVALLDTNNEDSIASGRWEPKFRMEPRDPAYFYNRPEVRDLGPLQKVASFWAAHAGQLPRAMWNKLAAAFDSILLALVVLLMACAYLAWGLTRTLAPPVFPLLLLVDWLLLALIFFSSERYSLPFVCFFLIPAAHAPVAVVEAIRARRSGLPSA